jgi:MFS family permease
MKDLNNLNSKILDSHENNLLNPDILHHKYLEAIDVSGLKGKYQLIVFALLSLINFCCNLILTAFPIQKQLPSYICLAELESHSNLNFNHFNKHVTDEACIRKFCGDSNSQLIVDYTSIRNFVTKLDVFCNVEEFSSNFTRSIFFSRIFATLFFSYITDIYGRKKTFFFIAYCLVISNLGFLYFNSASLYLFVGFLSNMCKSFYNLVILIGVETMCSEYYSVLTGILGFLYASCSFTNIFIMSVFNDWHVILYFHLFLNFVGLYFSYKYIVETPKYLLSTHRYDELDRALIKISESNGRRPDLDIMLANIKEIKINNCRIKIDVVKNNIYENIKKIILPYHKIYHDKNEFHYVLLMMIPYTSMHIIYFLLILNLDKLPGNLLTNSTAIYSAEVLSTLVGGYLAKNYKRRTLLFVFFSSCLFFLLLLPLVLNYKFLLLITLFCISYSVCTVYIPTNLLSAELFEVTTRSTATGILLIVANLSIMFGDVLIYVFYSQFILFVFCASLSILAIFKIPETFTGTESSK